MMIRRYVDLNFAHVQHAQFGNLQSIELENRQIEIEFNERRGGCERARWTDDNK